MINLRQYKEHVLLPVLTALEMNTPAAVDLMVGTALQESQLHYLVQLEGGPGIGFYQMEPATAEDIVYRYAQNKPHDFRIRVMGAVPLGGPVWLLSPLELKKELTINLALQVLLARLKYYMVPDPIPDELIGQARYWKQHYNTPLGAGTEDQYIANYVTHIGD